MSPGTATTVPVAESDAVCAEPPPERGEVVIRMYGQGIGDCFLLAFPRRRPTDAVPEADPERPVYVLIDCGVHNLTPLPADRMRLIVEDIRRATRDGELPPAADGEAPGHLDLLIVTHEHWDHLSGFIYKDAREAWQSMQVDALWTAWTAADDAGGLGAVLAQVKAQHEHALRRIAERAAAMGDEARLALVDSVRSFLGDAPAFSLSTSDGLDNARKLVRGDHVCCEPGEVRPVPGTDSVAYVLGPPRNWERLSAMNPDPDAPETYEHRPGVAATDVGVAVHRLLNEPTAVNALVTPLLDPPLKASAGDDDEDDPLRAKRDVYNRSFPFDHAYGVPLPSAEIEAAANEGDYPPLDSYFLDLNAWRRIDDDWLLAAEGFALWYDNIVNNTSLVLAFELPAATAAERKVLLFVADAQVGNWLSWDELGETWLRRDGAEPGQEKPDMANLLARTVFYKVGHHGSHNATLKAKGIERMRGDGELTAFVPVSAAVATYVGWDEMPLPEMLDALSARANGRVVLADGSLWPPIADDEQRRKAIERIGLRVSSETLPAKCLKGDCDNQQIEAEVPLWVEIAVGY
jgi:glyoxylase-like metal-dependent hydrolase (beta-lactamase superfamily II)